MKEQLIHLLKPKQFRVWCRPDSLPGDFAVTTRPPKATCANCLTAWRAKTQGHHGGFKVAHTLRKEAVDPWLSPP